MDEKTKYQCFFVCYLAYLFIYVARLNPSMATPGLKDLRSCPWSRSDFWAMYFPVIYACGRLLSGMLSDRIAPWKMISAGLLLCGISNLSVRLFPPFL